MFVVLAVVVVRRVQPATPAVERASLWIDSVAFGTLVRQVRAPGTLVPEQMRYVPAVISGRIEVVHVRPGMAVDTATILLELSNPEVRLEALAAEQQLTAAEAALVALRTSLGTQALNQRGVVAQLRAEWREASRQQATMQSLDSQGMAAPNELGRLTDQTHQLKERLDVESERLELVTRSIREQLTLQQRQVDRLQAIVHFHRERIASLRVRAGASGVLQEMALEAGQWVNAGTMLGRVAQSGRLKALLRVSEVQANDISIGQHVGIDTRNGVARGRVRRIDPTVQNGTVQVEVTLDGELPAGTRADLSVDGTIDIERLEGVKYVGRPVYGQPGSRVGLFRLDRDGAFARRVPVMLGRTSVNAIEIAHGLDVGDRVILSDVSQWDGKDQIRLK